MKRLRNWRKLKPPRRETEKVLEAPQLPAARAETLVRTRDALQLVPDFADEFAAPLGVLLVLDTLRRAPINHSQDGAAQFRLRQDHFHWVGRRAEDRADLKAVTDTAQQVDRRCEP